MAQPIAKFVKRLDGWFSSMTGLGGTRDKRRAVTRVRDSILDRETLRSLYDNDAFAARICDIFPAEAMRKGFEVKIGEDAKRVTALQARFAEMALISKLEDSLAWARVFGGGGLLLGVDDGQNMSKPLRPDFSGVRKIKYLTVLDRWDVYIESWYTDPLAPKYGEPELYRIQPLAGPVSYAALGNAGTVVHETRMVWFHGARGTRQTKAENNGWSLSVLQRVYDVLRDFGVTWAGAALLLTEASQAVYGVKGLMEILAGDQGEEMLQKRFALIEQSRSVAKAMLIDADGETFERKATAFAGVPDMLDRFTKLLSAAANVPVSVLMGEAPAGLNATGDADLEIFEKSVKAYQTHTIQPALEKIVHLFLVEDGQAEPEEWSIAFLPLSEPSDEVVAKNRLAIAQSDDIYMRNGALTPEEVTISRFTPEGWSMETTVNLDLRRQIESVHEKTAVDQAKAEADRAINPPPPVVAPGAGAKPGAPVAATKPAPKPGD